MRFVWLLLLLVSPLSWATSTSVDSAVYNRNEAHSLLFYSSKFPTDTTYWIDRNKSWGGMYGSRYQLGTGRAMRIAAVTGNFAEARAAWLGLKAGADAVSVAGVPLLTVPPEYGYTPTATEVAEAGSFFLGEACNTYLIVQNEYYKKDGIKIAGCGETASVLTKITAGANWLNTQTSTLLTAAADAPNRLAFDALAFYTCGTATGVSMNYSQFVDALVAKYSAGVFQENGGGDTHYQAVAINQLLDLRNAGYGTSLDSYLLGAAQWYLPKVDINGVIHSAGNTRTCGGGESYLGTPKKLDPIGVWRALLTVGVIANNQDLIDAADRIDAWIMTNPAETCID
jgi:hypothetical protein